MLTLDSPIRPRTGILIAVVILGGATLIAGKKPAAEFGRWSVYTSGIVGATLIGASRLRALWTTRQAAAPIATAGTLRPLHLYLAVALILTGLLLHARSTRYTVTYTTAGGTPTFQRIDTWTGATEVWFMGIKNQPRPAWVRFTGQQAAR